jgi:hypothetical protein
MIWSKAGLIEKATTLSGEREQHLQPIDSKKNSQTAKKREKKTISPARGSSRLFAEPRSGSL